MEKLVKVRAHRVVSPFADTLAVEEAVTLFDTLIYEKTKALVSSLTTRNYY